MQSSLSNLVSNGLYGRQYAVSAADDGHRVRT